MNSFNFWQRWLFGVGVLLTLFGLALVFFNQSPPFDLLFNNRVNPVFWPSGGLSAESRRFQAWAYGVLGATIAGWGAMILFVMRNGFQERQRWAWNGIAAGISLWYLADTAISLYFGVAYNAAFNTFILLLVWVPLALTWKYFHRA